MYFFPILHDNELLYSGIARYSELSGNLSHIHTIEDVFSDRNAVATVALPSRIKSLVENLIEYDETVAKDIIENHTLLNFYGAFRTDELYLAIEQEMIHTSGIGIHMKLGLVSSSTQLERYLKYCPVCVKEEVEIYGEPFWHREHQVFGAKVCHLHRVILLHSEFPVFGRNRQIFYRITPETCKNESCCYKDSKKSDILVRLAVEINKLCRCRVNLSLNDFKNRLRVLLYEKNYIKANNYTYLKKLTEDIREYYSDELLEFIGCSLDRQNWVSKLLNPNRNVGQPIQTLLLLIFLECSVSNFKEMERMESIDFNEYIQDLWDKNLIRLVEDNISQREICRKLGTNRKTILKALKRLNHEKDWNSRGGSRYRGLDYIETDEYRDQEIRMKTTWIELHNRYPNLSSHQIRKNNDSVYAWLKRYQNEWMNENYRIVAGDKTKINWLERDSEITDMVEGIILQFRSTIGTRITWGSIGGELGISGWLYRRRKNLPRCTKLIEENIESLDEYHLRVLRIAVLELIAEGVAIRKYTVLERAGVKLKFIPQIIEKFTEEDMLMGLDCLL